MKRLAIHLKNYKAHLIWGPFFKLLEAIFELVVPLVMAQVIDEGINQNAGVGYILSRGALILALGIIGLCCALMATALCCATTCSRTSTSSRTKSWTNSARRLWSTD